MLPIEQYMHLRLQLMLNEVGTPEHDQVEAALDTFIGQQDDVSIAILASVNVKSDEEALTRKRKLMLRRIRVEAEHTNRVAM